MSSYYNRSDADGVTTFNIVPAPYPTGSGLYGCAMAGVGLVTFFLLLNPLALVLVGWFLIPLGGFIAYKAYRFKNANEAKARSREPVVLILAPDRLTAGGQAFTLADIKEFDVSHEQAGPVADQVEFIQSGAQAVGVNARLRLQAAQHHVGYETSVRLKNDSRLRRLVGGLTQQTASTLAGDLADALSEKRTA